MCALNAAHLLVRFQNPDRFLQEDFQRVISDLLL
jgi:hypothetical protein